MLFDHIDCSFEVTFKFKLWYHIDHSAEEMFTYFRKLFVTKVMPLFAKLGKHKMQLIHDLKSCVIPLFVIHATDLLCEFHAHTLLGIITNLLLAFSLAYSLTQHFPKPFELCYQLSREYQRTYEYRELYFYQYILL